MPVNNKESRDFQKKLEALRNTTPDIIEKLLVGEGVFAVGEAAKICKNEKGLADTGHYRNNFHAGEKAISFNGTNPHDGSRPKRSGLWYRIDVYNNLDYAKPLEYGFRSHFVPGQYLSSHYRKKFPNGMYVGKPGGFVRGHFTLRRAVTNTKSTQTARLARKLTKIFNERTK